MTVARTEVDVRGWTVEGRDGRALGYVSDLLADADSLTADHVVVTIEGDRSATAQAETVVPVAALRAVPAERRLVPDGGMTPIRLRYQSTTGLVWWALGLIAATLLVLRALDAWPW